MWGLGVDSSSSSSRQIFITFLELVKKLYALGLTQVGEQFVLGCALTGGQQQQQQRSCGHDPCEDRG